MTDRRSGGAHSLLFVRYTQDVQGLAQFLEGCAVVARVMKAFALVAQLSGPPALVVVSSHESQAPNWMDKHLYLDWGRRLAGLQSDYLRERSANIPQARVAWMLHGIPGNGWER